MKQALHAHPTVVTISSSHSVRNLVISTEAFEVQRTKRGSNNVNVCVMAFTISSDLGTTQDSLL